MHNNVPSIDKERTANSFFLFRPSMYCFFLIFLGFTLTSTAWLSWLYHLIDLSSPDRADFFTLIVGYLNQALGTGLFILFSRKAHDSGRTLFTIAVPAFMLFCVPATLSHALIGSLLCGWLMNIAIGVIAGFYLRVLADKTRPQSRGIVFGGSYGLSAIVTWLFSMTGKGNILKSGYSLIVYTVASAVFVFYVFLHDHLEQTQPAGSAFQNEKAPAAISAGSGSPKNIRSGSRSPMERARTGQRASYGRAITFFTAQDISSTLLLIAGTTVFLFSLEKNIGFSFPSADLVSGLNLELSRMVYAAGLITAGLISDKSRKSGAILALTALVTPFIMLALAGEPISSTIFWGLDYFFYGFFSVYRVLLFTDLASIPSGDPSAYPSKDSSRASAGFSFTTAEKDTLAPSSSNLSPDRPLLFLAGAGLLAGRLGDAVGTLFSIGLRGHVTVTVVVTSLFFIYSVLMFFRLYQYLYMPVRIEKTKVHVRTDEEIFEEFSSGHGLTVRERSVLRLILQEKSNAEIAQQLFVSESTVKFHIHNILAKTMSQNRISLTAKYRKSASRTQEG